MNEYEREREERIRKNREELARLTAGLQLPQAQQGGGAAGAARAETDPETAAKRRRQREEEREHALMLARRSLRARGLEPVAESTAELELRLRWAEETRLEAEKRRVAREQAIAEARARGDEPSKCGRPVTWIGGGGREPAELARMGVPELRALFREVFGQSTASNNSAWLRKKLAEPPAAEDGGARRAAQPRARDVAASIWAQNGEEGPPGGGVLPEGGSGGYALPFMPRMMRPDPCLLDAKLFMSQGRKKQQHQTAAAETAPAEAPLQAAPKTAPQHAAPQPQQAGDAAAQLAEVVPVPPVWASKGRRTVPGRPRSECGGDDAPAEKRQCGASAAAPSLGLGPAAGSLMLQVESAPTSDNEHDPGRVAAAGMHVGAGGLALPPFRDGDALAGSAFPWVAPELGHGAAADGCLVDAPWGAGVWGGDSLG